MNNFARPGLGATELPPVNADDNGKVLGVSDGAWAKVAASGGSDLPDTPAEDGTYALQNTVSSGTGTLSWASGGSSGGVLVVTGTWSDDTLTLNKTWQEIHDADAVVIYATNNGEKGYYILDSVATRINLISGDTEYLVGAYRLSENTQYQFIASSASGYPAYSE